MHYHILNNKHSEKQPVHQQNNQHVNKTNVYNADCKSYSLQNCNNSHNKDIITALGLHIFVVKCETFLQTKASTVYTHNRFTALWILSTTTRVSRYQKKHSPTHTYCGHQSSLIHSILQHYNYFESALSTMMTTFCLTKI